MESYRILIVDDHSLFRDGLKRIIEELENYQVVGETQDGQEALRLIQKTKPDMAIVDIASPHMSGVEMVNKIKTHHPEIKILVLTMCRSREIVYHAYHCRIDGYLLKDDAEEEFSNAIERIRSGDHYMSPVLSKELTCDFMAMCFGGGKMPDETLTVREIEVIKLIAGGKSGKEIGRDLYISPRTVEHHRAKIMKKLNIRKNLDLVKFAIKKGYISL